MRRMANSIIVLDNSVKGVHHVEKTDPIRRERYGDKQDAQLHVWVQGYGGV